MGAILSDNDKGIHAEARERTFTLFTDFGDQRLELPWDRLGELEGLVRGLRGHLEGGAAPAPAPRRHRCHLCGRLFPKDRAHRMVGDDGRVKNVGDCCWKEDMARWHGY